MRKSQGKYCRLLLNNVIFLEDLKKSSFFWHTLDFTAYQMILLLSPTLDKKKCVRMHDLD